MLMMKKVYKAHILYTKEQNRFEVLENGYIAVGADGRVTGVAADLASLDGEGAEVTDFGDRLLIPAMNDLHVHAPQYRNQGIAMDLELMPWLKQYTFPEEMKFADTGYAERMYRRFVRDLWRFGTMRACVFATTHTAGTRLLMQLFREAGMGALVGKVAMNRVLTIESSGIAIATMLGNLYNVPVVFAKKSETANSTDDKYVSKAFSFTHKKMNSVFVSRPYLHPTDRVLIVDDFLADGQAVHSLIDLVRQAGGEVAGIGIAVEKGQQKGGRLLREEGYRLESLAIIEEMDWQTQSIRFREQ